MQWCKNLHFIGFTYPGNPEQCATFYDQSLLKNKKTGNDSADGTLNSGETKVAFSGKILKPDSTFAGKHENGKSFYLYSANSENEGFSGSGFYFQDGGQHEDITWNQLGGEKPFVKVYNPNGFEVKYVVVVE